MVQILGIWMEPIWNRYPKTTTWLKKSPTIARRNPPLIYV